jgi:hypothetical protein
MPKSRDIAKESKRRGPPRRFDREEAKRLRDSGVSYAKIAALMGVSVGPVFRALRDTAAPTMSRKEISRLGGLAVSPESRAYSKDRGLAREAGRKGRQASRRPKRSF